MAGKINLITGKIIGCEKNSFGWFHEKGHVEYNNTERGIINSMNMDRCLIYSILFIIISLFYNPMKYFAGLFFMLYVVYYLYEEFWCNKYARKKLMEIKNES